MLPSVLLHFFFILLSLFKIDERIPANFLSQKENFRIAMDAAAPPALPSLQDQTEALNAEPISYRAAFTKMIATLVALIVLIIFTVWMLRRISHARFRQPHFGKGIKILERRPLSGKSFLYLIEVNGKKILIAESQLEVRPIATVDEFATIAKED